MLATLVFYVLTGYGITEYQTVERLSGGLLTKALSFTLHNSILPPLIILLIAHMVIPPIARRLEKKKADPSPK